MTESVQPTGNRRIDRVLGTDYLTGLRELSMDDLRALRRDAEQEETDLSYLRRLLQGRLDILRAELARRTGTGPGDGDLVESLAHILADEGATTAPHGLGRHISAEPSRLDQHRRRVEALVADVDLSNPSAHDDESLRGAVETLEREEHEISDNRRKVQAVMDACTAEITRRYRDGDADVSDLLPSEA
jgi:hypothetical protein